MKYRYSVVIPTYNERENIEELLSRLERVLAEMNYEIIVADDDSPDMTWKKVAEFAEKNSRISVIRREGKERGLSQSIVDGFNNAEGEIFAVMDGDLQHDESFLPKMLQQGEEYDLVLGTRHSDGGGIEAKWPFSRRVASRIATYTARIILGISVTDPMSGYFVVRKEIYEGIKEQLNPSGFKILLEILFQSRRHYPELRIKETGIIFRPRIAGKSKLGVKVIFQYLFSLIKMRIN